MELENFETFLKTGMSKHDDKGQIDGTKNSINSL